MSRIKIGARQMGPERIFVFDSDTSEICRQCDKLANFGTGDWAHQWCLEHFVQPGSWGTPDGKYPDELKEGLKRVIEQYPELGLEI